MYFFHPQLPSPLCSKQMCLMVLKHAEALLKGVKTIQRIYQDVYHHMYFFVGPHKVET
jgi:hypothetical protein